MTATARYARPSSLAEALDRLTDGGGWRVVAGGTDHFPARVAAAPADPILDISGISDLRGVDVSAERVRFGALTTWTDVARADLPPAFDGLRSAAREVGGVQIQNRGTVAGNLCNASPAADGVPPFLSLDADVVLTGPNGERRLPLPAFMTGYRETALAPGELVTAIDVPTPAPGAKGGFLKLGARRYLVISIVMVAGVLTPGPDGRIARAALSVGACSAVARRLSALESALIGEAMDRPPVELIHNDHLRDLTPIGDPRGSAAYRADAARTLLIRLLTHLMEQGRGARAA
jgi:CO/xanthine dehydrogenase FAD-binding subunit